MQAIQKTIAWTGYFETNDNGEISLREDDVFSIINHFDNKILGYQIAVLDWHTVCCETSPVAYDLQARRMYNIDLSTIAILHILKLGYGSTKGLSLKKKWQEIQYFLKVLDATQIKTINPIETIRYGMSKHYLIDLQAKGIPIPNTRIVPSNLSYIEFKKLNLIPTDVIKPINGECGHLVTFFRDVNEKLYKEYIENCEEILIQEFIPEVIYGEKSLIFCENRLLFAVRKIPSNGNFKANGPHVGAHIEHYTPTESEIAFCKQTVNCYKKPLLIYRLDIISWGSKIVLMEVEVVDPGFYIGSKTILAKAFEKLYLSLIHE